MARKSTHNTTNQTSGPNNKQQTRKRGESDPNEPPKRRKTRHSNNDISKPDETEVEHEAGMEELGSGKVAKRVAKKAGQ
jgi:anti-sigma28 factor (negative regulator of flagellin synthesis)